MLETKKHLILIVSLFYTFSFYAQNNKTIYQAYLKEDLVLWENTTNSLLKKRDKTNQELLDILNYEYGYIAFCLHKKKKEKARKHITIAERIIEKLEQCKYNIPTLYAYKSAFTGFKIPLTPYKAPYYSHQSSSYAKKSVQLDKKNILGYVQLGNIAYYSPKLFGGSKQKALKHYLKALKLMEKEPKNLKHNWNYLNLLTNIIMSYYKTEQYSLAKKYYIKTLKVEPNFHWLKNEMQSKLAKY